MNVLHRVLTVFVLLATAPIAGGQLPGLGNQGGAQFFDSRDQVKTSVKAAYDAVPRDGNLPVAVIFDINPRWHIWPQEGGAPTVEDVFPTAIYTNIVVDSSDANALELHEGHIVWPEPHMASVAGMGELETFEGRAIAFVPVTIPADAPLGEATIAFKLTFQTCDDKTCLAPVFDQEKTLSVRIVETGQATASLDELSGDFEGFPVDVFDRLDGESPPPVPEVDDDDDETAASAGGTTTAPPGPGSAAPTPRFQLDPSTIGGFIIVLIFALIGGFILNLTPCVLPVIPLKIMGLAQSAGNRARTLALGIAMSLGVIAFWMALGVAIVTVSGFTSANQLFQYPVFTISIGIIIAILAVGMCGLFSVRLPQFVYTINPGHDTYHGSFAFGIMTAILSTPCTAPFMGSAAAAAVGQPGWLVLTVFGSIGLGMALPYLVLSAWPQLVDRMPRTGPASELIKQVMGLLLLAAAAYFVGVGVSGILASPPDPPSRMYWWFVFAFTIAAGGWLAWRSLRITKTGAPKAIFATLGVIAIASSVYGGVRLSKTDAHGPIQWVYYTEELFQEALADGNVVLMDFTAEWCLNCKLLEKNVLDTKRVSGRIAQDDVVAMKVDLTGNNKAGNQKLNDTGSVTIPWLVIFRPDGEVEFAQNWYTAEMVLEGIDNAAKVEVASRQP